MTYDDLQAALDGMQRETFRLEVQQSYAGVPDPGWNAWREGQPLPPRTPEADQWLANVAAKVAAGKRWYRVLVIDWPLNDYLHYELVAFQFNAAAGEEVFVVDRDAHPGLAGLVEDFWMVDEEFVAVMRYDADHRPLGPAEPSAPIDVYVAQRDLAVSVADPLDVWLAEHKKQLSG
ncbi:MAG: DUF6879 family protein [Egibacteraceae bacterium]